MAPRPTEAYVALTIGLARQIDGDANGKLAAAVEEYLEEFGDGADDPLPAL